MLVLQFEILQQLLLGICYTASARFFRPKVKGLLKDI